MNLSEVRIEYRENHTSKKIIKAIIKDKIRAYGSCGVGEDFYLVKNDPNQMGVIEEISLVRPEFIVKIQDK